MSFRHCIVCNELMERKRMITFSTNVGKRKKWIDGIGDGDKELCDSISKRVHASPRSFLCATHFSLDDFYINGSLKPAAVPKLKKTSEEPAWLKKETMNVKMECTDENMNYLSDEEAITEQDEPSTAQSYSNNAVITGDISSYATLLVDTDALLELLKLCPFCHNECEVRTVIDGGCLKASRICECANGTKIPLWSSSKTIQTRSAGGKEQLREINLDMATCTLSSGSNYKAMERFFLAMECPFISERTYHRHKGNYVKEAIGSMYYEQHYEIMAIVADSINKGETLNLYGDGQYDSRGYSAMVCRYIIMEAAHNFILGATVLRKNRGESSAKLEPLAHQQALRTVLAELAEITANPSPIKTFTSDRHKTIAKTMQSEFSTIAHKFDAWHFFRNVTMDILKAKKLKLFGPLEDWARSIINHMWYSVAKADGNGVLARELYMSVIEHIQGVHQFTESSIHSGMSFTQHTACSHGPNHHAAYIDPNCMKGRKALRRLDSILTAGQRLKDIESVSPVYATSQVESANALHMHYANKSLFFSEEGFEMRSKLSTIHWNALKLDEHIHKERTTIGTKSRYCKTRNQLVTKSVKSTPDNSWRIQLKLRARQVRMEMEYVPGSGRAPFEDVDHVDDDEQELGNEVDDEDLDEASTLNHASRLWNRASAAVEDEDEQGSDYSEEM